MMRFGFKWKVLFSYFHIHAESIRDEQLMEGREPNTAGGFITPEGLVRVRVFVGGSGKKQQLVLVVIFLRHLKLVDSWF